MSGMMILQFLVLTAVVTGTIIFFLHRTLIASTDGAVKRLNTETETVRGKQKELNEKIKLADEELTKRKKEAEDLSRKMMDDAESKAKEEREKIVVKARQEGEEIIAKAQRTKDKIVQALQKEMELKMVDYTAEIVSAVLSEKLRGLLDRELIHEFIGNLEKMDMSKIGPEINTIDIVTVHPVEEEIKVKLAGIVKTKLQREVKVNVATDPKVIGGMVLKFGSLALDGSLQNFIKEKAIALKQKVEDS